MGNYLTIGVLVLVLLSGGVLGSKISNLNPFKSNNKVYTERSSSSRSEYYRDKIKGIEHKVEEKYENKTPITQKETLGQKVGRIIDNSFQAILWYFIIGLGILILTGFNIFKWTKNKLKELAMFKKSLHQTSVGIQKAKGTMNGEKEKLLTALEKTQDDDVKNFIKKFKADNNIR